MFFVLDYELARAYCRKGLHLVDGTQFEHIVFLIFFDRYNFDCKLACLSGIESSENLSVAALAYPFNESVVINNFNHHSGYHLYYSPLKY
jgi:hypothetical protein